MRPKTSYFNKDMFLHTLRRFWPIWAGYLAIWLLGLYGAANSISYWGDPVYYATYNMPSTTYVFGAFLSFFFSILAAAAVFNHLYNIRSVGLMGSLPVYRETVFFSHSLAALAAFFASNVIAFLCALMVLAFHGLVAVALPPLLMALALVCLMNVAFFGLAVLCAGMTGHIIVAGAVYVMLNFAAVVVEAIVRSIVQSMTYGLTSFSALALMCLSPLIQMADSTGFRYETSPFPDPVSYTYFSGWLWVLAYAAVGALLYFLALWLYKRRRMETAGDFIAFAPLRPVFKYCFAAGCALVLTYFLGFSFFDYGSVVGTALMMRVVISLLLGGFIGYYAAEMMIHKSFHVFRGNWKGFTALAVVLVTLACLCEFDAFGIEKRQPADNDIGLVVVYANGNTGGNAETTLESPADIAAVKSIHAAIIAGKNENEAARAFAAESTYVSIQYMGHAADDGGRKTLMNRQYWVPMDSGVLTSLSELLNTPEAIRRRMSIGVPVTLESITYASLDYYDPEMDTYSSRQLSAEEALSFYTTCIVPDIEDGKLGRAFLRQDAAYFDTMSSVAFTMEIAERQGEERYRSHGFYITFTVDAARTIAWIEEHDIPVLSMGEMDVKMATYRGYAYDRYAAVAPMPVP